jgi:sodium/hydrogen antiporter
VRSFGNGSAGTTVKRERDEVFGAALPWSEWADLRWRGVALVGAILLLRRMPVLIALRRPVRLRWPDTLFLGWFGPVGVSALFYLTLEAERIRVAPSLLAAGALVVAGSTAAHGLTVTAGRHLYRRFSPPDPPPIED